MADENASKKARTVSFEEDSTDVVLEQVTNVQQQLIMLNEEASEQILRIEQAYNLKRQPHYQQRSVLLKQIPSFWKRTLLHSALISDLTTSTDKKVLAFLEEVFVKDADDIKSGFTITLHFAENPYFEDSTLVKAYRFRESGEFTVECRAPRWKGKDLTQGDANLNGKRKRTDVWHSFFNWFDEDGQTHDDLDAVARIIKEEIWPDPVQYYNEFVNDKVDEDVLVDGEEFAAEGEEGGWEPVEGGPEYGDGYLEVEHLEEEYVEGEEGEEGPEWGPEGEEYEEAEGAEGEEYEEAEAAEGEEYEDVEYDEDGNPVQHVEGEEGLEAVEEYEEGYEGEQGEVEGDVGVVDDEEHVDLDAEDEEEEGYAAEGPGAAEQVGLS